MGAFTRRAAHPHTHTGTGMAAQLARAARAFDELAGRLGALLARDVGLPEGGAKRIAAAAMVRAWCAATERAPRCAAVMGHYKARDLRRFCKRRDHEMTHELVPLPAELGALLEGLLRHDALADDAPPSPGDVTFAFVVSMPAGRAKEQFVVRMPVAAFGCEAFVDEVVRPFLAEAPRPQEGPDAAARAAIASMSGACVACQKPCSAGAPNTCGGCRRATYCSRECQVADWRAGHREACATLRRGAGAGAEV